MSGPMAFPSFSVVRAPEESHIAGLDSSSFPFPRSFSGFDVDRLILSQQPGDQLICPFLCLRMECFLNTLVFQSCLQMIRTCLQNAMVNRKRCLKVVKANIDSITMKESYRAITRCY